MKKKYKSHTLAYYDIVLQLNDDEEILYESDEVAKYSFVSDPLAELI